MLQYTTNTQCSSGSIEDMFFMAPSFNQCLLALVSSPQTTIQEFLTIRPTWVQANHMANSIGRVACWITGFVDWGPQHTKAIDGMTVVD